MPPKPKNAGDLKKTAGRKEPSAAVKMACGTCCLPNCHVLRRAEETGSNVSSGEFVSMVCTWAGCSMGGQMHKECYEKQEKVGSHPRFTLSHVAPHQDTHRHRDTLTPPPPLLHERAWSPIATLSLLPSLHGAGAPRDSHPHEPLHRQGRDAKGDLDTQVRHGAPRHCTPQLAGACACRAASQLDLIPATQVRPSCRCACTKGYFKPVAGEKRGSVMDSEEGESTLDAVERLVRNGLLPTAPIAPLSRRHLPSELASAPGAHSTPPAPPGP